MAPRPEAKRDAVRIQGWALSDVGRTRDHNEDSYVSNSDLRLFAVADGMGGHLGGERASRMAVEILEDEVGRALTLAAPAAKPTLLEPPGKSPVAMALRKAVSEATRAIWDLSQRDSELSGMGTTLTGLLLSDTKATIAHVGDSRAYLFRHGKVRQLTDDHSWIAEQVRAGLLSADDALTSRFRNIITRSVGFEQSVNPDIITLAVEAGDCFLLCSDGLSNHVTPDDMSEILSTRFYVEAPQALIDLANDRSGDDNITAVVAYVGNQHGV